MNKRVILYIPSLDGGGAERFIVRLANGLVDKGIHVILIVGNAVGPNLSRVSSLVNLVDLKCERTYKVLPKLIKFLYKTEYDAFLSTLDHANIISILAHIFLKKKSKLVIRQATIINKNNTKNGIKINLILKLLMFLSKKADFIVTTSKAMQKEFISESNIHEKKVVIIPNPIDIKEVNYLSKKDNMSDKEFYKGEIPLIVAVGRLEPVKGFEKLILAFEKLLKNRPAKLVILGEGRLRPHLQKLVDELGITNKVLMPGFIKNIYPYISNAEIFALTSDYEGFPNAMLEAMACGINIVAFDCPGGVREILEDGKWGSLVPSGDIITLSQTMDSLLLEVSKNRNLPNVAQRANDFSIETIVEKYIQIFFSK